MTIKQLHDLLTESMLNIFTENNHMPIIVKSTESQNICLSIISKKYKKLFRISLERNVWQVEMQNVSFTEPLIKGLKVTKVTLDPPKLLFESTKPKQIVAFVLKCLLKYKIHDFMESKNDT